MTCSTYRRITEDKEENTRKWPKKGSQRAKNPNFEKQKIEFFLFFELLHFVNSSDVIQEKLIFDLE